jgi:hypothetical protein
LVLLLSGGFLDLLDHLATLPRLLVRVEHGADRRLLMLLEARLHEMVDQRRPVSHQ